MALSKQARQELLEQARALRWTLYQIEKVPDEAKWTPDGDETVPGSGYICRLRAVNQSDWVLPEWQWRLTVTTPSPLQFGVVYEFDMLSICPLWLQRSGTPMVKANTRTRRESGR